MTQSDARTFSATATSVPRLLGLAFAATGFVSVTLTSLPAPLWGKVALLNVVMMGSLTYSTRAARSRRQRETGRGRRGWGLISAGFGMVGVAVVSGTAVALVRHTTTPVPLLDALSGLGLLLFLCGLVTLCGRPPLTSRHLSLVDSAMAAGACLFVIWETLLVPPAGEHQVLTSREQVLYGDLGGMALMLMLTLLLAARWRGDGRTLTFIGAGLGVEAVTLVGMAVASTQGAVIEMNDPRIGVVFPLGTFFLGLAAAQCPAGPATAVPMRRQWNLALGIPLASSGLVAITGFALTLAGRPWDTPALVIAVVVGTLLFVRQGLTLLENRRLTLDLEQVVSARTVELEESRRHFRDVVQHSSDVIAVVSSTGRITYCSPAVTAMLGYPVETVMQLRPRDLMHPADAVNVENVSAAMLKGSPGRVLACRIKHVDGTWRSIEATLGRSSVVQEDQTFVVNMRDVTERMLLEERIRHQAFHDPLTGLANRALIQERMSSALVRARSTGDPTALLFVDLDNFKRLNDTSGHSAGDQALVHVAEVIRSCIGPGDTAARLGGDEFAVLLEQSDAEHGNQVAGAIVDALKQLPIPQQRAYVSGASVGVSVVEAGRGDGEGLLRDADIAMYEAKASGRGRAAVFDPSMRERLVKELAMESALSAALHDRRLTLVYQPIVDLASGRLVALEALVRWRDERGHAVPPSLFIPLAEQVGLIGELDRWVVGEACSFLAGKPRLGGVALNVNVSARDLEDTCELESWVMCALGTSGLSPDRLVLEITETAVLPDLGSLAKPLGALRERGIRVSLDDFGTGYSSMTSLEQLPLDEIKIDGSFIAGLKQGENAARVVEGIVSMARSLQLPVIAEAVETAEQAELLRRIECDYAQGWYFAPPMVGSELEQWAAIAV